MLKSFLYVGLGGAAGSIARYAVTILSEKIGSGTYPYGTFLANILGSLLFGLLFGWLVKSGIKSEAFHLLLLTGFCGGFTTFSAFAFENYVFIMSGGIMEFVIYTIASFAISLIAVTLGMYLTSNVI
ncbi:fluoride efflux transporter CrcB [Marivirga sp. S37H4]|uniref:Fluoride-specific ion channel FluC n=1 Tax=Marivirga aurantiaca TaxID=2802615 RepID=A0A935C8B4_9BACT|nr:fluoride efflux transporter CrcB [Marivirga aurantiaca]MBK6264852.1 fluoride efflux transporter CrcB [Marivirga aurantiaca]